MSRRGPTVLSHSGKLSSAPMGLAKNPSIELPPLPTPPTEKKAPKDGVIVKIVCEELSFSISLKITSNEVPQNIRDKLKKRSEVKDLEAFSLYTSSAGKVGQYLQEGVAILPNAIPIIKQSDVLILKRQVPLQAPEPEHLEQNGSAKAVKKAKLGGTHGTLRRGTGAIKSGINSLRHEKQVDVKTTTPPPSKKVLEAVDESAIDKPTVVGYINGKLKSRPSKEDLESKRILPAGGFHLPEDAPIEIHPTVIHEIIQFLRAKQCEQQVGIFRLSGNCLETRATWRSFAEPDQTGADERANALNDCPVHELACALKLYLREAPASLLPMNLLHHYEAYVKEAGDDSVEVRLSCLKQAIDATLSRETYKMTKELFKLLSEVNGLSDVNKMNSANLSIVFGPNLFRDTSDKNNAFGMIDRGNMAIVRDLIEGYRTVFEAAGDEQEGETIEELYGRVLGSDREAAKEMCVRLKEDSQNGSQAREFIQRQRGQDLVSLIVILGELIV